MNQRQRHIIGCMTGTSLDGLDAVSTRILGQGLDITCEFQRIVSLPFDDVLRDTLRNFAEGRKAQPLEIMHAARQLGELHAQAVAALKNDGPDIDFVVAHGQTICHAPDEHLSWQLFDPWPIVRRLNVPVCYDLRQADLIAGGQGAPLTPIADQILFGNEADLIINLGGIVNVTRLTATPQAVEAMDIGPCNLLINQVVTMVYPDEPFDRDGQFSREGQADLNIFKKITEGLPFFNGATRSLGREDCDEADLWECLEEAPPNADKPDIVASAVETVAEMIVAVIRKFESRRVIFAGGGVRNATLMSRIKDKCGDDVTIKLCDDLGVPSQAREAAAFAVLGALSQDHVPITLPQVTQAQTPGVAGAWVYP